MIIKSQSCAIMQPTYLPWLGYFDLIANVDDFLFLDDVKFNKSSFHHQNKILGKNGSILLSVPTHANKGRMESMIDDVTIDNNKRWQIKHLKSIEQSYSRAEFYGEIFHNIEKILLSDIETLSELNIRLIKLFASVLSLEVKFHISSQLENLSKDRILRLIDFCKMQNCNYYFSPSGSLGYLDTIENKALFRDADIKVFFQDFRIIPYQQKKEEFVPNLSILDALMHCGPDGTKEILKQSHQIFEFK